MKFIADLHIHSHFSRATSKALNPENLSLWAQKKGITVVGTGDFTHPGWVAEIQEKMVRAGDGLYQLKPGLQRTVNAQVPASCLSPTQFLLSGEISCIYKKNGKTRKAHHLILMPDMESVLRLNERLDRIGNITSDGRPILGLDSRDLLEITLEASDRAFFIPAHIWTPWFSVFGSKSGFDTLDECFDDLTGHIHALETGLSSDPPMNRCISALDDYLLISNSDAHSPSKLGREANIFDTDLTYDHMIRAMTKGNGFLGTIEFYPEEGKYHLDGHRKCQVRFEPFETREQEGICPVCGKPLTVGVLHRVDELSDRDTPKLSKKFFSLVPLAEVLSQLLNCGPSTKKVAGIYEKLLLELGPELRILMDVPLGDIEVAGGPLLKEALNRMRRDQVVRLGGYDGEYGVIRLFHESEKQAISGQMALFAQQATKTSKIVPQAPRKKKAQKTKKMAATEPVPPTDPILDPLNPEQLSAVKQQGGDLIVVAGPGTGKTMTLTHRIAHLIREGMALPEQILALTFTRKAAREMAQRISGLLQGIRPGQVRVSTFHGFCLEILRSDGDKTSLPSDFTLCSVLDADHIAKECLSESGAGTRLTQKFIRALPQIKTGSVLGSAQEPVDQEIIILFERYQQSLRKLGMLDLDDLEVEALRLLRDHKETTRLYAERFPCLFVDEYQDTNQIQVELLKTLIHSGSGTICAIGDPDQAIYGFRGADVSSFHRFNNDFPGATEIKLEKNYRSTEFILKGSAKVMEKPKSLQCESSEGSPIFIASCRTDAEEAEMVVEQVERLMGGTSHFSLDSGRVASHEGELSLSLDDIGVLYRLNAQGDTLEKALNRAGIPFVRSGETPLISRYPINIIWRFFQTLRYPDNPYYARMYDAFIKDNGLAEKVPKKTFKEIDSLPELIDQTVAVHDFDFSSEESAGALRRMKQLAQDFEGKMAFFLDTLSLERGIDHTALLGDRLALMSLHAAKGLEWPVVFITGCEDKLLPCSLFGRRNDEEERRLFYVGMTRAQKRLILSHVTRRSLNGRLLHMKPSPFIDAITEDLCKPLERAGWKERKRAHKQLELF